MTTLRLEDWGARLTSRATGALVREEVEAALARGTDVVIDCRGVDVIAPSFADELFGKLFTGELGTASTTRVSLARLPPDLKPAVQFAVAKRRP